MPRQKLWLDKWVPYLVLSPKKREWLLKCTLNSLWKGMLHTDTCLLGRNQNKVSIILPHRWTGLNPSWKKNKLTWWGTLMPHIFTSLKHHEIMYIYLWLHTTKKLQLKLPKNNLLHNTTPTAWVSGHQLSLLKNLLGSCQISSLESWHVRHLRQ